MMSDRACFKKIGCHHRIPDFPSHLLCVELKFHLIEMATWLSHLENCSVHFSFHTLHIPYLTANIMDFDSIPSLSSHPPLALESLISLFSQQQEHFLINIEETIQLNSVQIEGNN